MSRIVVLRIALGAAITAVVAFVGVLFVVGLLVWLDYQFGIRCCAS